MAQRLNDDLGGRTVFCDGWAHDDAWLGLLFDAAGLVPRFKLEPVNALLDETGRAGLDAQRALAFAQLGMAGPAPAATRGRCNGRCSGWRFARQHMLSFVIINKFVNGDSMAMQSSDIVPISEARARLTELAEDVVGNGAEKLLTKNGASYVALIDARRLDHYHALEEEHARLVLAADAITGLRQALASEFVADAELDDALGGGAAP